MTSSPSCTLYLLLVAATAGQQITAGKILLGIPVNAFPDIHLTAVHIHKDGSDFLRLKNRKTVPASFGIVDGYNPVIKWQ